MRFIKKSEDLDSTFDHRHLGDVIRIQRVAEQNGYEADLEACAYLWEEYSDRMAAGWIGLPDDDEDLWREVLFQARVLSYVKGFEV